MADITKALILEALDWSKKNPDTRSAEYAWNGKTVTFFYDADPEHKDEPFTATIDEAEFRGKKNREFAGLLLPEINTATVETTSNNVAPAVPFDEGRMPVNTISPPDAPLVARDATASAAYQAQTGTRVRVTAAETQMQHDANFLNNTAGHNFKIIRSLTKRYARATFDLFEGKELLHASLLADEMLAVFKIVGKLNDLAQAAIPVAQPETKPAKAGSKKAA